MAFSAKQAREGALLRRRTGGREPPTPALEHVSQMSTKELEHYFIVITSVPKQKKPGFFPEDLNGDGHLNGKFFTEYSTE